MGTSVFRADKGHYRKADRSRFLYDADDNATSVVTIVNPVTTRILIDEIVAGYNGAVGPFNVSIVRNAVTLQTLVVANAANFVLTRGANIQEGASIIDAGFDVVITLDASGAGGTDGFLGVRFRYEGWD